MCDKGWLSLWPQKIISFMDFNLYMKLVIFTYKVIFCILSFYFAIKISDSLYTFFFQTPSIPGF